MDFGAIDRLEHASCETTRVDLISLLDHVTEEYGPKMKKMSQSIEYRDGKKFYLEIDEEKWMQLLHNIVSNFIKYA